MRKTSKNEPKMAEPEPIETFVEYHNRPDANLKAVLAELRDREIATAQSLCNDEGLEILTATNNNSDSSSGKFFKKCLIEEFESTLKVISVSQKWNVLKQKRQILAAEMADHYEQFVSTDQIIEDKVYAIIFKVMGYHGYKIRNN